MNAISAYWRTIQQYWRNPKNRHDAADYARAAAVVTLTALAVYGGICLVLGKR